MSQAAILSHKGGYTSFEYGGVNVRFRTSDRQRRYVDVKEWDEGYIVVMAEYDGVGIVEEYIDLIPIMESLYMNTEELKGINEVRIEYDGERD